MASKLLLPAWGWCILVLLCSLRACHLYWLSTRELRAALHGPPWPVSHRFGAEEPLVPVRNDSDAYTIGSSSSNMFYFAQISDLHLSKYRANGHTLHFLHFIRSILPIIKPNFVVVTGDLTDAKDVRRITSQQYLEEWLVYKQAIAEGVPEGMPWYDMRGNHDCFDLPSWQSRANLYRTYGASAQRVQDGQGIYTWQLENSFGRYRFVAIDACPKRGPSRPFNFFGYLTSKTMDRLAQALEPAGFNHTFVFSHYPTTTMVFGLSSKGQRFRDLARQYSAYFCGHLHRLAAGIGDVLKWYDPKGHSLELELGDMMHHGVYRIVAVDHDLISFVDVEMPVGQFDHYHPLTPLTDHGHVLWPSAVRPAPVILITNPKDARYALPTKEPLQRIRDSSHIRFLAFLADGPPKSVTISIDGKIHPFPASPPTADNDPLWTTPWDPRSLDPRRSHTLRVTVVSQDGQVGSSAVVFRLDGQRAKIAGGPGEFIIASNMAVVLQCMTLMGIAVMLAVLIIPLFLEPTQRTNDRRSWWKWQLYIWVELPKQQPWCWLATTLFLLALVTLPWFRAEFIPSAISPDEQRYGTFYMWGLKFGADEWVPIADTWMFAAGQIWLDVAAFLVLFALDSSSSTMTDQRQPVYERAWFRGLVVVYWLWRVSELVALASFYGGIGTLVYYNILVLWMVFVGTYLAFALFRRRPRPVLSPPLLKEPEPEQLIIRHLITTESEDDGKSSSSSSTPFNGSPRIKSRKKSKV